MRHLEPEKSSGARGQRFGSSRAYHTAIIRIRRSALLVQDQRIVGERVVSCTYASRRGGSECLSDHPTTLLEAARLFSPRPVPAAVAAYPPVVRFRPNRRPGRSSGRKEGSAWSFAGTVRLMHFSARSAPCVINLEATLRTT